MDILLGDIIKRIQDFWVNFRWDPNIADEDVVLESEVIHVGVDALLLENVETEFLNQAAVTVLVPEVREFLKNRVELRFCHFYNLSTNCDIQNKNKLRF